MSMGTNVNRRTRIPLIEGGKMHCPRCKELQDILKYKRMIEVEEFQTETNPIYKCPECRWLFSPALTQSELLSYFGLDK